MKETGKIIAKERKKKGLSTSDLARKLKVRESLIKKWEAGTKMPNLFQLKKLTHFFDVKISKLVSDEVLIQSIEKNHRRMWLRIGLGVLLIALVSVSFYFTYRHFTNHSPDAVYIFKGKSDGFSFEDGIVTISRNKRYISLSKFDCDPTLDINRLTINIAFNNEIWVASEYPSDSSKTVQEWLNKLTIKEYGDSNDKLDSFLKHNNDTFIDNMQVEINYCDSADKCTMEIMDLELEELKLNNKVIEDI